MKEMGLKKIRTKEGANVFLEEYLPMYNAKFRRVAKNPVDIHREIPSGIKLERVLSIQDERVVRNDNTVRHEGKFYQIEGGWTRRPKWVIVQRRLDGLLYIFAFTI